MEEEEEFEEFEDEDEDEFDEPEEEPAPVKKKKRPVVKEDESEAKPEVKAGRPKTLREEAQQTVSGEEIVSAIQNLMDRMAAVESALFRLRGAI